MNAENVLKRRDKLGIKVEVSPEERLKAQEKRDEAIRHSHNVCLADIENSGFFKNGARL